MTKAQRLKAMGLVLNACQAIKDKKPLAEAVRKIVDDLRYEEAAHKEAAREDAAANADKGAHRQTTKDRRFAPDLGNAIKRLSDDEFSGVEHALRAILKLPPKSG